MFMSAKEAKKKTENNLIGSMEDVKKEIEESIEMGLFECHLPPHVKLNPNEAKLLRDLGYTLAQLEASEDDNDHDWFFYWYIAWS